MDTVMLGIDVKGMCSVAVIVPAVLLAVAMVSVQSADAAAMVSTGPEYPHPNAPDIPVGQTAEVSTASADILRQKLGQDMIERIRPTKPRGLTFDAPGGTLAKTLDGVKLLGWNAPGVDQKSGFDMTVEFHGLGLQLEDLGTYGYLRADRALLGNGTAGFRFRYRF
jgi:hypothetical protein